MTRKRWRLKGPMLVPATWQGSVEHFYHFFLGYFVPVTLWQERTQAREVWVRDCGPMNPWFDLLAPDTELKFLRPGVMLQRYVTKKQEWQVLRGWDDPNRFNSATLTTFAGIIRDRLHLSPRASKFAGRPTITLLSRGPSPDFYLTKDSEGYSSGADWRSIPNERALAEAISDLGDIQLIDSARLTPSQQVTLMSETDLLVAQHGAGLSNMVWLPPGAAVVEIQPPLQPTIDVIFRNLAAACGHRFATTSQEDEHSPVQPDALRQVVQGVLDGSTGIVPNLPGRWPLNRFRQLPRRW